MVFEPMTRWREHHRAGFTLLEILVALTLFGLIAVAVAGGIRFGARVWETGRQTAEASGEVHQAQSFVRQLLSGAILIPEDEGSEEALPSFLGEESRLLFSAAWLTSFDRAGIYQFEIALSPSGEGGQDMVVRWRGLQAARQGVDFGESEQSRTLLSSVERTDGSSEVRALTTGPDGLARACRQGPNRRELAFIQSSGFYTFR
jgi:general secretion pathway protein J